jgi:hypothetical protein
LDFVVVEKMKSSWAFLLFIFPFFYVLDREARAGHLSSLFSLAVSFAGGYGGFDLQVQ